MQSGDPASAPLPSTGAAQPPNSVQLQGPLSLGTESVVGRVPGSKSIAQRLWVCALLSKRPLEIEHFQEGADALAARRLVESLLQVEFHSEPSPSFWSVRPRPLSSEGPTWLRDRASQTPRPRTVEVGESGTLARLITAALALGELQSVTPASLWRIEAEGSLLKRSSPALFKSLRAAGVMTEPASANAWPLNLTGCTPPGALHLHNPSSSQEVSALISALAFSPNAHELHVHGTIPSRPYLDMTLAVLQAMGSPIQEQQTSTGVLLRTLPDNPDGPASTETEGVQSKSQPIRQPVEPDASAAAVLLALAAASGGQIHIPGWSQQIPSTQGDLRVIEHLRVLGCDAQFKAGVARCSGAPRTGDQLDLVGEPDLAPVFAGLAGASMLARQRQIPLLLTGLGTLPGKESSRIEVLRSGLEKCGLPTESGADWLRIGVPKDSSGMGQPAPAPCHVTFETCNDHRMAFAFSLLASQLPSATILEANCVRKSWPNFWAELARLGMGVRANLD